MNKIIIEETITSTIKTGVGKHTDMLNTIIKDLECDYEIVSNDFIKRIKNATIKRIVFLIWLNTFFWFKLLFEKKNTIVIYTSFLPFIKISKIFQIGIIHDILLKIFPEKMSKLSEINNKLLNFSILNNADRILTVSNTVKKEIDKYYSYPEEKIFVVYNTFSLNKNILIDETSILNKFNILNENYVLSVSSMNPNKNLKSLIDSFNIINKSHPNLKLVLIGGKTSSIEKLKKLTANSNIIFTGYINDEELKVLYKNAKLYAFPSIYEGFGIPIIDAQLFEIPVLCSDIPVFREVAQNSVEYFQPDSESIANKICSLISSNDRCQELINFGVQNIKRFTLKQIYIQLKEILNIEEKYGCNDSICKL